MWIGYNCNTELLMSNEICILEISIKEVENYFKYAIQIFTSIFHNLEVLQTKPHSIKISSFKPYTHMEK